MEAPQIFLVEELELRISIEAVEYKHKFDNLWEQYKFDPDYFNRFMEGPLLSEFVQTIYKRTQLLEKPKTGFYRKVN